MVFWAVCGHSPGWQQFESPQALLQIRFINQALISAIMVCWARLLASGCQPSFGICHHGMLGMTSGFWVSTQLDICHHGMLGTTSGYWVSTQLWHLPSWYVGHDFWLLGVNPAWHLLSWVLGMTRKCAQAFARQTNFDVCCRGVGDDQKRGSGIWVSGQVWHLLSQNDEHD